ncbi:ArnT family glycosyltransferase [Polaromonas sp. SM01]|uniref:ArnT family glycosyltransferase n=1 Tax=Polaromonas sp. SM01 TaxID=3085630 RepID=UPI00298146BC|nr:glycosyltransferase family 39 protein [Polaromonas sp. SM01]MDW5443901.1 glycosyltransferase family 39 protein [Polaromonas sp. SM01]
MTQRPGIFAALTAAASSFSVTRWLITVGVLSLALRLWISATFPITGDEAFFYWWGVYPDWGYYDHPPMVGWLIALMRATLGDTLWSIRLPVVMLPLALGALVGWALSPLDKTRAAWAVVLFWLAPINWLNVLITTDTPLIFWSVLSVALLLRAERRERLDSTAWVQYALSGLFLGCAFLSKYFSVVLGLTYLVYFVLYRRERWAAFVVLVLCALPGPAINIAYNMSHGWSNIMFNLYNRNEGEAFAWYKPLLYVAMLVYLATPAVTWLAWRQRKALAAVSRQQRLLACVVLVPLLFFALLAFKKVVGLHWVLSFYPFGFALLAFALPLDKLKSCALGMAAFAALHVLIVAGLYSTSLADWKKIPLYPQIVRSYKTTDMLQQVQAPGVVLMANAYTPASIYGYSLRDYVPVFGPGNFHARQDDMLVDFSIYQGKTVRIIHMGIPPRLEDYAPYFDNVQVLHFSQDGVPFYAVEGANFNYPAYKSGVLSTIYKRYYNIPSWLPMTGCPFCERLCGQVRCEKPLP